MTRAAIAILLLLIFGGVRLPLEIRLAQEQQAAGFHSTALNLPLREQIGQAGFIAALSGFRSLVAAYLWIEANSAFENVEWGRMAGLFQTVTTLQPKSILYWGMSGWHMAWNASVNAYEDKSQPSEALRMRAQRQYWNLGRKFFEDGLKANPDSGELWAQYGDLLRQKYEDHEGAFHAYQMASTKPDARPQYRREAGYELAAIPGKEREAYQFLKSIYDMGPSQRMSSVIHDLKVLEEKLGIPPDQRIEKKAAH
ncbi:MAG TPA: hypothetical protein VIM48_05430 [Chthoniobacterales bacterium]